MRGERHKRAVILLNGEPYRGHICGEGAYVICCDGAYTWAKDRVKIDELLGDFDSLDPLPQGIRMERFPIEKDETDGELAVDRVSDMGATDVVFYGGGGKREDHFLGNLHLLYKAKKAGTQTAALQTNGAKIILCGTGEHSFPCKREQTVSLLPFGGDAHIMEMRGLKYAPEDLWLCYGSTRGISNLTTGGEYSFRVTEGDVLAIINEEAE